MVFYLYVYSEFLKMTKRIIAIGDIHGCSTELRELLQVLSLTEEDHIVFLGDLINRGPESRGVLDIVHSIKNKTLILGNHELRLLKYRKDPNSVTLKKYDYSTLNILTDKDWILFESMVPTYYVKEYETVFVHGGFLPGIPWQEQPADVIARIQTVSPEGKPKRRSKNHDYPLWSDLWVGPPFVVYGHIPKVNKLERATWSLGLDTACVLGGSLSAYILPSKEVVSVPAHKNYMA